MTDTALRASPRRGGRPSRDAAERLGERIIETATEFFLRDGYGGTSIEAIAQEARISKRTFYHRFDGKPDLFAAVVRRIVGQIRPPPEVPLLLGSTLAEILERLAGLMLHAALSPQAVALNRLLVAESARFPELVAALAGQRARDEAVELVAGLLEARLGSGGMQREDAVFAAGQFVQMVISWPQRRALGLGAPMTAAEQEDWVRQTVRLFLDGCRGWRADEAAGGSEVA